MKYIGQPIVTEALETRYFAVCYELKRYTAQMLNLVFSKN